MLDVVPELSTAPRVLDGVATAGEIKAEVAEAVRTMAAAGHTPGLAVVLVGENPASQIYVRNKVRTCGELGIYSELHTPPAGITTEELLSLVLSLNARDEIDGILVQLPLPAHIETNRILEAVDARKDVDGFHPLNGGRLLHGAPISEVLTPCTPAGILEILKRSAIPLAGTRATMVGKSNIVGKPMSVLLMNEQATVTVCNRFTRDLAWHTRHADLLIVAIGQPGHITADMIQPGATVIDVGINRLTGEAELERYFPPGTPEYKDRIEGFRKRGSTVIGDVDPRAFALCGAYTPVPGGVGALTIAMLMANTVKAARFRRGL
jgi:methylenetetrahydrofolate dehydrogenase (NADP+)/methenyltetrahydrofolate cyclohydrolase